MSVNSNATTQQPATKNPLSVIDIYSTAQMPLTLAPDGVMRWKPNPTTKYIMHGAIILPRIELPVTVDPTSQESVEITAANQALPLLVAGSSIPHIWGRNNNTLVFRDTIIVDIAGGGSTTTFLDLVGGGPTAALVFLSTFLVNFKNIGNVVDMITNLDNYSFTSAIRGIVLKQNPGTSFSLSMRGPRII